MLTVVDELNPGHPDRWQDAAKIVVSQIFKDVDPVIRHLNSEEFKLAALEGEKLISQQFEAMLINSMMFSSDRMFWCEFWRNLGTIAAAGGLQRGSFPAQSGYLDAPSPRDEYDEIRPRKVIELDPHWFSQEQIVQTLVRKQMDYGHENISRFGRQGLIVRVHDKIARLNNLLKRKHGPQNESIDDTYLDIVGYASIGMMWERGWFHLELTLE